MEFPSLFNSRPCITWFFNLPLKSRTSSVCFRWSSLGRPSRPGRFQSNTLYTVSEFCWPQHYTFSNGVEKPCRNIDNIIFFTISHSRGIKIPVFDAKFKLFFDTPFFNPKRVWHPLSEHIPHLRFSQFPRVLWRNCPEDVPEGQSVFSIYQFNEQWKSLQVFQVLPRVPWNYQNVPQAFALRLPFSIMLAPRLWGDIPAFAGMFEGTSLLNISLMPATPDIFSVNRSEFKWIESHV